MKQAISTSIEQSRRLLSCGVDPKTADMVWLDDGNNRSRLTIYTPIISDRYKIVEAWSLSVLLAMLPNLIMADNRMQFTFRLIKCKDAYIVEYSGHNTSLYQSNGATAIEACVRMIETLTNNKHPLNKIEE